ncbi:helix-turn-helix transcriptional regulator [Methanocella sp. MCL-LM]|uniref:helix-turn-helix transcriptional regulator n=1 Tax=Methanocella sp. MCL-LM TaxID=3412035 RepID=UPI003C74724F
MRDNDLLSLLASSKLRRDILIYLEDGPKTLSELRDHLGVGSSQLSTKLRELLEYDLISAERKTYTLTTQGSIILVNYWPLANTVDLFDRLGSFWNAHDIECIPEELRYRIGELHNARYVKDDTEDINRTLSMLLKIMTEAKQISGVSSIYEDSIVGSLLSRAKQGIPVEMILARSVMERMEKEHNNIFQEFSGCANYHHYATDEEIKTPLILTDTHLYFSTYYSDGMFDTQSNLISDDPVALKWGRDLLNYYKARAVKK